MLRAGAASSHEPDPPSSDALYTGTGKPCKQPSCNHLAVSKGLCIRHGGGKQCAAENCRSKAQSGSQYCRRHGGSKRCTVEGCDRVDVGGGLCRAHGGGKRCAVCGKAAVSAGKCVAHGGGKRCKVDGCEKGAQGQSDFCKAHGGGRRCQTEGCNKGAQGSSDYCIAHGGGTRCRFDGCTKLARRRGLCQTHLRDSVDEFKDFSQPNEGVSFSQPQLLRQSTSDKTIEEKIHASFRPVPASNPMHTLAEAAAMASVLPVRTPTQASPPVTTDNTRASNERIPPFMAYPSTVPSQPDTPTLHDLEVELLIHVPDMACRVSCGARVENVLRGLPFVNQTAIDMEKKIVRIVCSTAPAFENDLAASTLFTPGLDESLVQEQFIRFSKSRFAIVSSNLDTIGFPCRLIQVYKIVRTRALLCDPMPVAYEPQHGAKRKRLLQEPPLHDPSLEPNWLISTALGLLETGCMMRFGRDCSCGDECQCEACPKHARFQHNGASNSSPSVGAASTHDLGPPPMYEDVDYSDMFVDFLPMSSPLP